MTSEAGAAAAPALTVAGERRYERKYRVEIGERELVEAAVFAHPAAFREIHRTRCINNIYFDTPGERFLREHLLGLSDRIKIRLRWYGDPEGPDGTAGLEIKGRQGAITWKRRFEVPGGAVRRSMQSRRLIELPETVGLPEALRERIPELRAALFNRYRRRYFLTRDGRYRATVDSEMAFGRPGLPERGRLEPYRDPAIVLELKHDVSLQREAAEISCRFPFPRSKNSKYVTGMILLGRARA